MPDPTQIAKEALQGHNCEEPGACAWAAAIITKALLDAGIHGFSVYEGWVDEGNNPPGTVPSPHTWVAMNNGKVLDPTFAQFPPGSQRTPDIQAVFTPEAFLDYAREDMGIDVPENTEKESRMARFKGQNWYIEVSGHGKMWFDSKKSAEAGKKEVKADYPDVTVDGPYEEEPKSRESRRARVAKSILAHNAVAEVISHFADSHLLTGLSTDKTKGSVEGVTYQFVVEEGTKPGTVSLQKWEVTGMFRSAEDSISVKDAIATIQQAEPYDPADYGDFDAAWESDHDPETRQPL